MTSGDYLNSFTDTRAHEKARLKLLETGFFVQGFEWSLRLFAFGGVGQQVAAVAA